jgi:hypothetical protein
MVGVAVFGAFLATSWFGRPASAWMIFLRVAVLAVVSLGAVVGRGVISATVIRGALGGAVVSASMGSGAVARGVVAGSVFSRGKIVRANIIVVIGLVVLKETRDPARLEGLNLRHLAARFQFKLAGKNAWVSGNQDLGPVALFEISQIMALVI